MTTTTAVSYVLLAVFIVWLALIVGATWIQLQDDIGTADRRGEGP